MAYVVIAVKPEKMKPKPNYWMAAIAFLTTFITGFIAIRNGKTNRWGRRRNDPGQDYR